MLLIDCSARDSRVPGNALWADLMPVIQCGFLRNRWQVNTPAWIVAQDGVVTAFSSDPYFYQEIAH